MARVWDAKIKIDLVTLESTNQVPLTIDIREQWAKERKYIGMDFLGQCYAMVPLSFTSQRTLPTIYGMY